MLRTSACLLILTITLAAAAAAPPVKPAAPTPGRPAPPAAAGQKPVARSGPRADPGPNALESDPLRIEAMGLTFNPPAGAVIKRTEANNHTPTVLLTDPNSNPDWRISIQPLFSTLEEPTAEKLAQQHLDDLAKDLEPGKKLPVISSAAVHYGDVNSWLFYLPMSIPQADQDAPQRFVTGFLIMPTGPKTFVVFSSVVSEAQFPAIRPLLETSFATIRLESLGQIDAQRKGLFDAGRALIATFTPDRLSKLMGEDRWFRVYKPGANGEQELAVYHLQVIQAKRGTLNPDRDERLYDAMEDVLGLMVRVQTRLVSNASKNVYIDALFSYWMAWDRSEEAWSEVSTIRQGDHEVSEAKTGVRSSGAHPKLTVVGGEKRNTTRNEMSWDVPEGYLSQSENWLLDRLLPRDLSEAIEYGFYFYNSAKNDVVRRTDRWSPAGANPEVAGAAWVLSTTLGSDGEPTITHFDDKGVILRQVRPNGAIAAPITEKALRQLWEGKGLKLTSAH